MEKENKDERKRREIIVVGENEFCALRAASGRCIEAVVREESDAEARIVLWVALFENSSLLHFSK